MAYLYCNEDALTFFVGGDNFVALCPDLRAEAYDSAIDHVEAETGVEFRVGVATAATAQTANGAKHALEVSREDRLTRCLDKSPAVLPRHQSDD